jgi:two-component system, OmpR family, phosphate regulon response regulator OmpR
LFQSAFSETKCNKTAVLRTDKSALKQNMASQKSILIVDDDTDLRRMVAEYLVGRNFKVTQAGDGEEALRQIRRSRPDIVLVDQMMPRMDGLELVRRLRGAGDTIPIIMLTARAETIDRIIGLELGCDDYVGKPFDPRELLARLETVLRRAPPSPSFIDPDLGILAIGDTSFDPKARTLTKGKDQGREVVHLTASEAALLARFCAHPHVAMTRDILIETVHGDTETVSDRAIDVAVLRLRRMIEPDPARPRYIQTVRGSGYVFIPADGTS